MILGGRIDNELLTQLVVLILEKVLMSSFSVAIMFELFVVYSERTNASWRNRKKFASTSWL